MGEYNNVSQMTCCQTLPGFGQLQMLHFFLQSEKNRQGETVEATAMQCRCYGAISVHCQINKKDTINNHMNKFLNNVDNY